MTRPAIQLYTLRTVDRPVIELLELVADAGFEGVEFAYRITDEETDVDAVLETLEATGLDAASAHVPIEALEDDFAETVAFYDDLGVEHVVVPWLDADHFASSGAIADAATRLESLAADLAEHGMTLHYHNHDHEYTDLDGRTGFDAFVEATDLPIELDLGLALAARDDVVERLRSLGERSRLVHLKDYDAAAGKSVPVGEGDLDLDGIAEAVTTNDSEWLIYEYEGADPVETLERAAARTSDCC